MTREDWESLSANPGWAALRRYLLDFRARMMEQWASRKLNSVTAEEASIRCEILADLAEMDWESIRGFYQMAEADNTNNTQQE